MAISLTTNLPRRPRDDAGTEPDRQHDAATRADAGGEQPATAAPVWPGQWRLLRYL